MSKYQKIYMYYIKGMINNHNKNTKYVVWILIVIASKLPNNMSTSTIRYVNKIEHSNYNKQKMY